MKFDKVLVPIDGSAMSEIAVDLAVHSAGTFATHLTFLYVVDTSTAKKFGEVDGDSAIMFAKAAGKLALEAASHQADSTGIPYDAVLKAGIPWEVITEATKEHDMAIMGITGKSGVVAGHIGRTAVAVIENAYCPVLTLKSGSSKIDSILLPVANKNEAAIDVAIETAKRIKGSITVLSVKDKENPACEETAREVVAKIQSEGIEGKFELVEGSVVDSVVTRSGKYDLVIMGTHGRKGLKKILNGSVAERVVVSASCPVTIVRQHDR
jgi:nucleotide-binding universal stress UspA family protein